MKLENKPLKKRRFREIQSNEEVHNNWAISYGDMITLLLGFFVLFFNIKTDTINLKLIQKNLMKKFSTSEQVSRSDGPKLKDKKETSKPVIPIVSKDIKNPVKISTNMQGEKLLIEFPGVSFFNSGGIHLSNLGKKALQDFADTVSADAGNMRFVIRGYTDNRKFSAPKSRIKDNLELSAFRSLAAIRFLNKQGISLSLMRIAGYAEASTPDRRLPASENKWDRKIAIVVEPLDASEKVDQGLHPKEPKKAIEDQNSASIPFLKKEKIHKTRSFTWFGEASEHAQHKGAEINQWINKQNWYKTYLSYLINKEKKQKRNTSSIKKTKNSEASQ